MDSLQTTLLGALIGLARATDGNEHLISPESTAVILECLAAKPGTVDELHAMLSMVEKVKQKMIPDCFRCANPCGRTAAYDLALIDLEEKSVQDVKYSILRMLLELSEKQLDPTEESLIYHGLIAIGLENYTAEELVSVFPISIQRR